MNLFQNPFYIMGVSTRDSKQSIVNVCDEKSLTLDAGLYTQFRSVLTHPRNRLSAELAWLPGLSPARSLALIERLEKDPMAFLSSLDGVNPLSRCNALATYLEVVKLKDVSQLVNFFIEIAHSFEQINRSDLLSLLNEDRKTANIPLIPDVESIKEEMQNRCEYIISIFMDRLDNTKEPEQVLTEVVTITTFNGAQYPPILIRELVNKYQIEVQKYLDQLVVQIRILMTSIQEDPKKLFDHQMPAIYRYLKMWDQIIQPIHLIQMSKGIDDAYSKELAKDLRSMVVSLANSYGMHIEAKQLTEILIDVFKELPQFAEKISEDLKVIEDILKQTENINSSGYEGDY